MIVDDCMTKTPVVIGPTASLVDAAELMTRHRIRHLPVVDPKGRLVGLITDRDLRQAGPSVLDRNRIDTEYALESVAVEKVMIRSPTCVTPTQRMREAIKVMISTKYGALPVVEDGPLVGIVSTIDVLKKAALLFP